MNRRKFMKEGAGLAAFAAIGAVPLNSKAQMVPVQLIHYVLFWLKPGLSATEIDRFSGFFEQLKVIPSVRSLRYGRAAPTPRREVTDNSFTYSMVAVFNSIESHNAYQKDPVHLAAVEKYGDFWDKVVVYDALMPVS